MPFIRLPAGARGHSFPWIAVLCRSSWRKMSYLATVAGRLLTLTPGQELKDLQIRLQAAAVVRGRVTDEDGDPMPDAQVSVLKQSYKAGHSRWERWYYAADKRLLPPTALLKNVSSSSSSGAICTSG